MNEEIIYEKDSTVMFKRTAERLFKYLQKQRDSKYIVLGLCGGRSVVGLLAALKEDLTEDKKTLLRRIQFFMVDERLVPHSDSDSNYGLLKKLLFDDLISQQLITEDQLHPFYSKNDETDHGTARYMHELNKYGGRFSAIVLGVGEDAHVAGLFPGNPTLQRDEVTFLSFYNSPKPPPARMTATVPLLQTAEFAVVLMCGEAKREAWKRYRNGSEEIEECPVLLVKRVREIVVVTDLDTN